MYAIPAATAAERNRVLNGRVDMAILTGLLEPVGPFPRLVMALSRRQP